MALTETAIPEIIIEAAECGVGVCFNHAIILCTEEQQDEVIALFKKNYTSFIMKEMVKLSKDEGVVGLHYDPEGLNVEAVDQDDYDEEEYQGYIYKKGGVWSFDPEDISEYGIIFTAEQYGLLITFPPQNFTDESGETNLGGSSAVEKTLKEINKQVPTIKYWVYEGCFISDVNSGEAYTYSYGSKDFPADFISPYIGSLLSELWKSDDFWDAFIETADDAIDEDIADEIIEFLSKYGDKMSEPWDAIKAVRELERRVSDTDIADLIVEKADLCFDLDESDDDYEDDED